MKIQISVAITAILSRFSGNIVAINKELPQV